LRGGGGDQPAIVADRYEHADFHHIPPHSQIISVRRLWESQKGHPPGWLVQAVDDLIERLRAAR
jgi:hypothetical protein